MFGGVLRTSDVLEEWDQSFNQIIEEVNDITTQVNNLNDVYRDIGIPNEELRNILSSMTNTIGHIDYMGELTEWRIISERRNNYNFLAGLRNNLENKVRGIEMILLNRERGDPQQTAGRKKRKKTMKRKNSMKKKLTMKRKNCGRKKRF